MKNYILLIDLEATCWVNKEFKEESEIIEIGGAILEINSDKKETSISSFFKFVKPVRHPILSDYCLNLTSISQENVDMAQTFPQALQDFVYAAQGRIEGKEIGQIVFGSWGEYDRLQLYKDCAFHGVKYPFGTHWNVKKAYSAYRGVKKGFSLSKAVEQLELKFEGKNHRGIDDARMVAIIVDTIYKKLENSEIIKICEGK